MAPSENRPAGGFVATLRPLGMVAVTAVVMFLVVALLVAATAFGAAQGGASGSGLSVFAFGALVALCWLAVAAVRTASPDRAGLRVDPDDQPALWGEIRRLSTRLSVRAPDELRLVPAADIVMYDRLGPWGTVRTLHIGVPLLMGLSVGQFRATLAREFAHHGDVPPAHALVYRLARRAALLVEGLAEHSMSRGLATAWASRYFTAARQILDGREIAADARAAHVVGVKTATAAAREVQTLATAWAHFLEQYLFWALEAGSRPAHALGGFHEFLTNADRGAELARVRRGPQEDMPPFDTRPPLPRRVIELGDLTVAPMLPSDDDDTAAFALLSRPAVTLEGVFLAMLNDRGRALPAVSWEELFASAGPGHLLSRARLVQEAGDQVLHGRAVVDDVLDLVAAGKVADLVREGGGIDVGADAGDLREVFEALVGAYLAVLGMDAGALRWSLSWERDATLVRLGSDGTVVDDDVERSLLEAVRAALDSDAGPAKALLGQWGVAPGARVASASHRG